MHIHFVHFLTLNFQNLDFSFRLVLSTSGITLPAPYYQPEEDDERPFICSLAQDNGIMSCRDVPARREGGRECCLDKEDVLHRQALGLSAEPLVNGSASAMGLCVNWNQYYTRCHTGYSNPHKGAINFDNIGYAWIVIFQVRDWVKWHLLKLHIWFWSYHKSTALNTGANVIQNILWSNHSNHIQGKLKMHVTALHVQQWCADGGYIRGRWRWSAGQVGRVIKKCILIICGWVAGG